MKLGTKISSLLILTALIPPIIILSYALLVIGEDRYQTVTQDVLHQVKFSGEWLSTELESAQREIELYTQRPELKDLDPAQFLPYLKQEINRQQGRFEKFIIGTPEGNFYNTSGGNRHKDMLITFDDADPNSDLQHLRHRDYWQYTVGSNTTPKTRSLISDSMISYTTGIRQIVLASTIINNNTLVGMLGVSIG